MLPLMNWAEVEKPSVKKKAIKRYGKQEIYILLISKVVRVSRRRFKIPNVNELVL